jgi:hypothetical protein
MELNRQRWDLAVSDRHSAARTVGSSAKSKETPMNIRRLLLSLCLEILVPGVVFGTPVAAMATGAHVGEMAKAAAAVPVHAPDTNDHVDETALTSRAVIAVDDHWSLAEMYGDTAWLGSLLLPGYRSVRADGSVWDRNELLVRAARNRGHGPEKLKAFDAWLKTHPMNESVIIHGHVSILSFLDPQTGRVRLSNVFVYEKGRWHALYSQLTRTDRRTRSTGDEAAK